MVILTDRQIRAARALLDWTQTTLSDRALVAPSVVKRAENGERIRSATMRAICDALYKAGVRFAVDEEGESVKILHSATAPPAAPGAAGAEPPARRPKATRGRT